MFRVFCEHGQTVCELLSTHAKQVSVGVTPTAVGDSANTTDNTVDMQSIYFKYTMGACGPLSVHVNIINSQPGFELCVPCCSLYCWR